MISKRKLFFSLIFIGFLSYFFFTSYWHIPSRLVLEGNAASGCGGVFQWDSGSGYNFVQSDEFFLGKVVKTSEIDHSVKIVRTGKKNSQATSSAILIRGIRVDGNWISFDDFRQPNKKLHLAGRDNSFKIIGAKRLLLTQDGKGISFKVKAAKNIEFWFYRLPSQGIVAVAIDDDRRLYDLYNEQADYDKKKVIYRQIGRFVPGHFKVAVKLPQYNIDRFRIKVQESFNTVKLTSLYIQSRRGRVDLPVNLESIGEIEYSDIYRNTKCFFHPTRFFLQILFAAFCTWILTAMKRAVDACGGIKGLFFNEKRNVFWTFFFTSSLLYSFWLAAYWPGHMTSDSIHIWWAALKPGYLIYSHPFINVLFYRFLQQIWNNFAIVGIFQILLTSATGSYILFYLHKKNVRLYFLIPFYIAFITSVPVGLYNITLWKDIPFANAMLVVSVLIIKIYVESNQNVQYKLKKDSLFILVLASVSLCLFRHNGIVFFVFLPLILTVLKIIPLKRFVIFMSLIAMVFFIYVSLMESFDQTHFFSNLSKSFMEKLRREKVSQIAKRCITLYPRLLDINSYSERRVGSGSDLWYSNRAFVNWHQKFIKQQRYNYFIKYQKFNTAKNDSIFYDLADTLVRRSYLRPWVYFSWNPYYMLYLLIITPIFIKKLPVTTIFFSLILFQTIILMIVLGNKNYNWRYYYFLFYSLYFLIPLILLDVKSKNVHPV